MDPNAPLACGPVTLQPSLVPGSHGHVAWFLNKDDLQLSYEEFSEDGGRYATVKVGGDVVVRTPVAGPADAGNIFARYTS